MPVSCRISHPQRAWGGTQSAFACDAPAGIRDRSPVTRRGLQKLPVRNPNVSGSYRRDDLVLKEAVDAFNAVLARYTPEDLVANRGRLAQVLFIANVARG
jgi:hypothetical protein